MEKIEPVKDIAGETITPGNFELLVPDYGPLCYAFMEQSAPLELQIRRQVNLSVKFGMQAQGMAYAAYDWADDVLDAKADNLALLGQVLPFKFVVHRVAARQDQIAEIRADLQAGLFIEFQLQAQAAQKLPAGLRTRHAHAHMLKHERSNLAGLIEQAL